MYHIIYHIIPYHTLQYHIISSYNIIYHIMSYVSYYVSYNISSYHVIHIILCIISYHISYQTVSYLKISYHIFIQYHISYHVMHIILCIISYIKALGRITNSSEGSEQIKIIEYLYNCLPHVLLHCSLSFKSLLCIFQNTQHKFLVPTCLVVTHVH